MANTTVHTSYAFLQNEDYKLAIPTEKNSEIEALITSFTGRSRVNSIRSDVCVFSENGEEHNMLFADDLSAKEFTISGMCQTCQDAKC
jgi:hypothetical protein